MSSYFGVSISVEVVLAIHRESKGVVYMKAAPGVEFDIDIIESFRRAINFEEVDLPNVDGDITQASIKGKYVVIRAGKLIYTAVIINQKPNRFTREALHSFGIRLESRWGKEIRLLYEQFDGDISVFTTKTDNRASADDLVEDVFHLSLSLPHKLGLPMNKMKGLTKKVWQVAENLARGKGYIFLADLVDDAKNKVGGELVYINDAIFEIVSLGLLIPIPLEEFLSKYN